jgi:hypothetical protein
MKGHWILLPICLNTDQRAAPMVPLICSAVD